MNRLNEYVLSFKHKKNKAVHHCKPENKTFLNYAT
jgi:hypothetical protein